MRKSNGNDNGNGDTTGNDNGTPQEIEEHMQSCEGAAYHAAILAGKEALTRGLTATIGAPPPQRRKYFSGVIVMRSA